MSYQRTTTESGVGLSQGLQSHQASYNPFSNSKRKKQVLKPKPKREVKDASASNFSASKLSRNKLMRPLAKHTASVIILPRHQDSSKIRNMGVSTKRKQSSIDFSDKIKGKIEDFQVLASCLAEYVREERRNKLEPSVHQILKMIGAFTRSELKSISKPLDKLIHEIIKSIEDSLPCQEQFPRSPLKPIIKKDFESPQQRTEIKPKYPSKQPISTIKKHDESKKRSLEQNLHKLKYQSNRLKYFFDEISGKSDKQLTTEHSKEEELMKLQKLVKEQAEILEEFSQSDPTFREDGEIAD